MANRTCLESEAEKAVLSSYLYSFPSKHATLVADIPEGSPVCVGDPSDYRDNFEVDGKMYDAPWLQARVGDRTGWVTPFIVPLTPEKRFFYAIRRVENPENLACLPVDAVLDTNSLKMGKIRFPNGDWAFLLPNGAARIQKQPTELGDHPSQTVPGYWFATHRRIFVKFRANESHFGVGLCGESRGVACNSEEIQAFMEQHFGSFIEKYGVYNFQLEVTISINILDDGSLISKGTSAQFGRPPAREEWQYTGNHEELTLACLMDL